MTKDFHQTALTFLKEQNISPKVVPLTVVESAMTVAASIVIDECAELVAKLRKELAAARAKNLSS